ncbi:MAG: hypothetical protein Q8N99_04330 [Nanoarchaeota archaeon]|nr:hypothetical protein [Nanoarchaeota archaeon]
MWEHYDLDYRPKNLVVAVAEAHLTLKQGAEFNAVVYDPNKFNVEELTKDTKKSKRTQSPTVDWFLQFYNQSREPYKPKQATQQPEAESTIKQQPTQPGLVKKLDIILDFSDALYPKYQQSLPQHSYRVFKIKTKNGPVGLLDIIKRRMKSLGYEVDLDDKEYYWGGEIAMFSVTDEQAQAMFKDLHENQDAYYESPQEQELPGWLEALEEEERN